MQRLSSPNRSHRILLSALLLFVLVALLAPMHPVYAASITVNSSADNTTAGDTFCTLREAMTNANSDSDTTSGDCTAGSGSDVITFDNNYTVTLGSQLPAVTTTMTITGNGAANTIIEANTCDPVTLPGGCTPAAYRVFEVSGTGNLTLNSLTVRHGNCPGTCATNNMSGGGIYTAGTLSLNSVTVSKNKANSSGNGNGGGINIASGTTTLDATTVSGNSSPIGGGILNFSGTLTIQNSSVIGGAGAGNSASSGGGIYNTTNRTVTINASTVSANSAGGTLGGGGINNDGFLYIQNGTVIGGTGAGNSASGGDGGGVANYSNGTVTVNSSTISANTANGSGKRGGGIFNNGGTVTVDASFINANSTAASGNGGGIYSTGSLTIQNGSTVGVSGAGNSAGGAGGIYNSGTLTIDDSSVSANSATQAGGIANAATGTLTIQNDSLIGGAGAGNTATTYGGGIFNDGSLTVNDSIISANSATNSGGGVFSWGPVTIQNGSLIGGSGAGNSAGPSGSGGGLFLEGTSVIDASTVSANSAGANGGGIAAGASLTIQNGSVIGGASAGNSAVGGAGMIVGGTTTINASTVSANTATGNGGGIVNNGTLTVQNGSTIGGAGAGNSANYGAGIFNNGTATVTGSKLIENTAASDGGGVYNVNTKTISVTGSCMSGNSSTAFENASGSTQTATGNWWGHPTGPGGVGPGFGDTVSSAWNYSGFLTSASLDCAGGPGGLTASRADVDKIDLTWADGATDESEFRVERSPDGSTGWSEIGTPAANSTSYQDSGLDCWTTYYYRVRAYRSTGSLYSPYTSVASASPCAPSSLALGQITQTSASLRWDDNSADETEFRLENSADGSTGWTEIAQPAANSTSYPVSGLSCSQTSYYRVRAYRSSGSLYSTYSNVLKVDTVPCMVTDGSLEVDSNSNYLPDAWAGAGLILGGTGDGRDCTVALVGSCSMRIKGNGTTKSLFQSFYLRRRGYAPSGATGGSGQRFTFSAASKADNANGSGVYQAVVTVYYDNGTTLTKILTFSGGTHAFETQSVTFLINQPAYAVVVTLSYAKPGGTVWFDNVSLTSP